MRTRHRLAALVAAAALVTATVVGAQSATAGGFGEQVSGNFSDTAIDTNGDTAAANLFSGATTGRGSATYEGIIEIALTPDVACDGGVAGHVVEYSIVRRYANGDLLRSRLVEDGDNSLCFDPGTGSASLDVDAMITGGTGRYAGASGTYHASYDVQLLVADPAGGIAHGTFTGTTRGTLD